MASSSRCSHRTRRDRLSIHVLPGQSHDAEPQSPYLRWLFGESSEVDAYSRLVETGTDSTDGTGHSKADAVVMKEVAAWLELRERDEFWTTKDRHANEMFLPTTSQLLARLKDSDSSLTDNSDSSPAFDALVQAIAMQLLASCYTLLPASSASHLPLFKQRTSRKLVTALRAHASYRLAPAAGHHARAPSESSPWPGLYSGPEREDAVANIVSQRRRSAKHSSEYVPRFAASGWTDGTGEVPRQDGKHNTIFSRMLSCSRRTAECSPPDGPRRAVVNPSLGSRMGYRFVIPKMRKVSATPIASYKGESSVSVMGTGRGNMGSSFEYCNKTPVQGSRRRSSMIAPSKPAYYSFVEWRRLAGS